MLDSSCQKLLLQRSMLSLTNSTVSTALMCCSELYLFPCRKLLFAPKSSECFPLRLINERAARWCYPEWALCGEDVLLSEVPWCVPPVWAAPTSPCMHSWGLRNGLQGSVSKSTWEGLWCRNSLLPWLPKAWGGEFSSTVHGTELFVALILGFLYAPGWQQPAVLRVSWRKCPHMLVCPALKALLWWLTSNVLFLRMKCVLLFPVGFTNCCFSLVLRACQALFLRRDNEFKSVFLFCVPGHMSDGSN